VDPEKKNALGNSDSIGFVVIQLRTGNESPRTRPHKRNFVKEQQQLKRKTCVPMGAKTLAETAKLSLISPQKRKV
jgi:hypothetical protein